jgi:NADH dehydrogenase FAD-containing subunit
MHTASRTKHIVLAGAGHAHLYIAKHAEALTGAGIRVTLIEPDRFWYSGLATGMLGGQYPPEQDQVDARPLIENAGGNFLQDTVEKIHRDKQILITASGEEIRYDALSLNIGSSIDDGSIQGSSQYGWHVKPIVNLWNLRQKLEMHFTEQPENGLNLMVVGGGLTGCEIAANLQNLATKFSASVNIRLFTRNNTLLPDQPEGASEKLADLFHNWDIDIRFNTAIQKISENTVFSADGQSFTGDEIILATGLRANKLIAESGLSITEDGSMVVQSNLQSIDDPSIFGAGDCIFIRETPLPKLGVFAVRESPILLHNLQASVEGKPLRNYNPQRRYLSILNLGDGTALALWGGLYWFGKLSMILKEYLDLSFLKQYQDKPG